MKYTRDQFLRLIEAVEDQGGDHSNEVCADRDFSMLKPLPGTSDRSVKMCNEMAIFDVPYAVDGSATPEMNMVRVCAVDDDMGKWPRFKDQVAG